MGTRPATIHVRNRLDLRFLPDNLVISSKKIPKPESQRQRKDPGHNYFDEVSMA